MVNCERCKKIFRDQYNLTCHQSRKNKCEEKINPLDNKISSSDNKISFSDNKISSSKCMWCLELFSTKQYKNIHEQKCKLKNDPIRQLEIESGIFPTLNGTVCRFCDKDFSRKCYLIKHQAQACKEREIYHLKLKQKTGNTITYNNVTVNNGTINNIVYNYNEEKNVTTDRDINRIYHLAKCQNTALMVAGEFIVRYKELLNKQPENRNMLISDHSPFGKIRIAGRWKKATKHRLVTTSFKRSAQSLTDQIDLLGLVYNTEQIDEFVETGLDHPDLNYRERCRLTNEYKIQMII